MADARHVLTESGTVEPIRLANKPLVRMHPRKWKKFAEKTGGANAAGELGGWYVISEDERFIARIHRYLLNGGKDKKFSAQLRDINNIGYGISYKIAMVKQDSKDADVFSDKNMAEVVAGKLMRDLNPDDPGAFANVYFAATEDAILPDPSGKKIYVVSEILEGFEELYVAAFKAAGKEPPEKRPVTTPKEVQDYVRRGQQHKFLSNLERVILHCFFTGNVDVHSANIGVIDDPNNSGGKKAVAIDFGAAFENIDGEMRIGAFYKYLWRFLSMQGPNNHTRDYPRSALVTLGAVFNLQNISQTTLDDLKDLLGTYLFDAAQYYGVKPLLEFAARIGMPPLPSQYQINLESVQYKNRICHAITNYLALKLSQRANYARKLAMEFQVTLCFDVEESEIKCYEKSLDALIKEDPQYFVEHLYSGRDFHFYLEGHKSAKRSLSARLHKIIKQHPAAIEYMETHPYIEAFSHRLERGFNEIYYRDYDSENLLPTNSGFTYFALTMLGWPTNKNVYNYIEWVFPGLFGLVPLIKNTAKLLLEYVPFFLEAACEHGIAHARHYLKHAKQHNVNGILPVLATMGIGVGLGAYYALKTFRYIIMRVTSPINAMRQAYDWGSWLGAKLSNNNPRLMKAAGYLAGGISLLMTLAMTSTIAVFASPLLAPIGAKLGFAVVSKWIATNAPHISQGISQLGTLGSGAMKIIGWRALTGLTFTETLSGIASVLGMSYVMVGIPIKAGLKKLGAIFSKHLNPQKDPHAGRKNTVKEESPHLRVSSTHERLFKNMEFRSSEQRAAAAQRRSVLTNIQVIQTPPANPRPQLGDHHFDEPDLNAGPTLSR